jgi:hypothetical protein
MNTMPPAFPRIVPTLTEVVEPELLVPSVPDEATAVEVLVESLTRDLSALIERRLTDVSEDFIRNLVREQLEKVAKNMKIELESMVRALVLQTFSSILDQHKQK